MAGLAALPALAQQPGAGADWFVLTDAEAAFLGAAMARSIPADELTPSATDLGGVRYLDRQLASRWGEGRNWYLEVPIGRGTEQQGDQLGLSPRDLDRTAIAALQNGFFGATESHFEDFDVDTQDAVLTRLSGGAGNGGGVGSGAPGEESGSRREGNDTLQGLFSASRGGAPHRRVGPDRAGA